MGEPKDLADWLMGQGGVAALLLARTLGMALSAPGWGTPALGWRIRLALAVMLTMALVPAIGPGLAAPGDGLGLGRALLAEAMVGAALGMSAGLIVAAARQ